MAAIPQGDMPQILDLDALPASAYLDARQLSKVLCCSTQHVRRLALRDLPPIHIGRLTRWRVGAVTAWLAELEKR